jgi:hypothetical protein
MFIVQMWWGRAHEFSVQDLDENGDDCIRHVVIGSPDPERRTFSCHGDSWKQAIELGQAFGWQRKGPLLHRIFERDAPPLRETLYEPDGWIRGVHEVEADDAHGWGVALAACLGEVEARRFDLHEMRSSVLIREDMTLGEYRLANRGMTVQFLRGFAAFLVKGPFRFGWDS